MAEILLVQVDDALARALDLPAEAETREGIVRAGEAAEALPLLERPGRLDALVVGPAIENPVQVAQRAHATDPDLSVLLLAEPERESELRRAVQFAPFLGPEVHCCSTAEGALHDELKSAVQQTRQRREFRTVMAGLRMPEPAPPPLASAEFLDRVLAAAPIGVLLLDRDGRVRAANARAASLLAVPERSLLGRTVSGALGPGCTALLSTGGTLEACTRVIEHRSRQGLRSFEVTASPILGRTGEPGFLLLMQDVTARVEAERSREEALGRLRFLLDANTQLSTSLELEDVVHTIGRIVVPMLADWCFVDLALPGGGFERMSSSEGLHEELARSLQRRYPAPIERPRGVSQVIVSGRPQRVEQTTRESLHDIAHDAQHEADLLRLGVKSWLCLPLEAHGEILGAMTLIGTRASRHLSDDEVALAEDLARRVAASIDNARLHAAAREELRRRDEFISIASHELRTPLTVLQLDVDRLARSASRGLPVLPTKELQRIRRSTTRMTRLIYELLDISRLTSGTLTLEREQLDLASLTSELVAEQQPEESEPGSAITVHAPAPVEGTWDRMRLEQVVSNLLSNALKYGEGKPIEVRVGAHDGYAVLSVADQGVGISPESQGRIFERFARASSERNYGGFGLGLWIARRLVEAMGGRISVRSNVGEGATFTVVLPRDGRAAPPEE